jgi:TetR/AcrR family transcriptional repressor of nem operon
MTASNPRPNARLKLLEAAMSEIRTRGFSATTVDDLCARAGVTKGAFFHHFRSKYDLGVAAAQHWSDVTTGFFAAAPYHKRSDPLDRVIGYLEFRRQILQGAVPEFTCLVGTMVQEVFATAPAIREACDRSISNHAASLEADIAAAALIHRPVCQIDARSLALHTQAVLQGAFILAKARSGPAVAVESVDHLIRYVSLLFGRTGEVSVGTDDRVKPDALRLAGKGTDGGGTGRDEGSLLVGKGE